MLDDPNKVEKPNMEENQEEKVGKDTEYFSELPREVESPLTPPSESKEEYYSELDRSGENTLGENPSKGLFDDEDL